MQFNGTSPARRAPGTPSVAISQWTGCDARALRMAMRMTNEGFAELLGVSLRTVVKWNTTPGIVPITEIQQALDTVLGNASAPVRARFAANIGAEPSGAIPVPHTSARSAESVASVRQIWEARRAELQRVAAEVSAELAYLEAVLSVPTPVTVAA